VCSVEGIDGQKSQQKSRQVQNICVCVCVCVCVSLIKTILIEWLNYYFNVVYLKLVDVYHITVVNFATWELWNKYNLVYTQKTTKCIVPEGHNIREEMHSMVKFVLKVKYFIEINVENTWTSNLIKSLN